jgi:type IV secretion system protein VirD4
MKHWYYRLINIASRIAAFFSSNRHLYAARFARVHELTGLVFNQLDGAGLLVGHTKHGQLLQVRSTPHRQELGNLLAVAQTRGGKGLLAESQLLSWKHSVVVNDIKGDLFLKTAGHRETLGPVYVFDPTRGMGHRLDPLAGMQTEDELLRTATNFINPEERDGAVFTKRACNILTQLFLAAKLENQAPLPYVRQMIRSGMMEALERLQALDPDLATQVLMVPYEHAKQTNFQDKFLFHSWGTLDTYLRPLLTDTVVRSFAGSDFAIRDLLLSEKPVTVYLRWRERDLLALTPLVRLMWKSFADELTDTYDARDGEGCHPVLFLIDEAGRTPIPSLSEDATTVVGRGISLWVSIQSLSQLDVNYGRSRASTLLDNMDTQLYYRPPNRPGFDTTADLLETALGKRSGFAESHTSRHGTETSEGRSEQGVPVMSAWEIKQLKDHELLVFHRGVTPFKATRVDHRELEVLQKRYKLPPPVLPVLPPVDIVPLPVAPTSKVFSSFYMDPDGSRYEEQRATVKVEVDEDE